MGATLVDGLYTDDLRTVDSNGNELKSMLSSCKKALLPSVQGMAAADTESTELAKLIVR